MDAAESQGTNGLPQCALWWWCPDAEGRDGARGEPRLAVPGPAQHWVRAIDVDAPPDVVFAWLTQLRRAPYSYDWADNFGRRSPQAMDRDLVDVSIGDSVMTIFTVTRVVPNHSIRIVMDGGAPTLLFGRLVVQYEVEPRGTGTRLSIDMIVPLPPGPMKTLRRYALAWGDLFMMRKQLKELKRLSEATGSVG